jgi:hypothetical protein
VLRRNKHANGSINEAVKKAGDFDINVVNISCEDKRAMLEYRWKKSNIGISSQHESSMRRWCWH